MKAPRASLSVGTKLSWAVVALVAAATAIVAVALARRERDSLVFAKERAAAALLGLVQQSLVAPVVFEDVNAIAQEIGEVTTFADVVRASVWSQPKDAIDRPRCLAAVRDGCAAPTPDPGTLVERTPDRLRLTASVVAPGPRLVAVVSMEVSLAAENAAAASLTKRIAAAAVVIAAALCALLVLAVRRLVVARLHRLVQNIQALEQGDTVAVEIGARDEVGRLAEALRKMASAIAERDRSIRAHARELAESNRRLSASLDELHDTQKLLVAASRKSGMADVATEVLHNVGNALNSINVAAGVVSDCARNSRVRAFGRTLELLRDHAGDLGAFFTLDERGKHLPAYLEKLVETVGLERETMLVELLGLQQNIDHVKSVIANQLAHAKVGGALEPIRVEELIDDALRLSLIEDTPEGIEVVRDLASMPPFTTDRHKVSEILLNLISNAGHALEEAAGTVKRLVLRARCDSERLSILVEDTGCGIAAENLTLIFNHGFTTRTNGHGFGLHSSACAAAELDGTLEARSDGPGAGATFVLTLPLSQRLA
jgi:signal transduction histidine kinase